MSERIDLKQFEGISKGKWEHDGGEIHAEKAERNNTIIAQYPSWNYNVKDNDGILTVEDASNLIAMAAVPDLLAELKKCYEAIDVLSKSTIDDAVNSIKLAKKLAKQNRDIEEIIDCLDGVDSIFGEEIIGMLRPLLARF